MIFGAEILEQISKNNEKNKDMIEILKQNNSNIPVETIFSHIIYILSCYKNVNKDTLQSSISYYHNIFQVEEFVQKKSKQVNMLSALEKVCFKNPSLEQSFEFLEDFVWQYIQAEYANLSLEKKANYKEIFVAQIEQLTLLKSQRTCNKQKKTRIA